MINTVKMFILSIISLFILVACESSHVGSANVATYNSSASNNILGAIPPSLKVRVEPHNNTYYTTTSNNPYYVAISVANNSKQITIESITIDNDPNGVFAISNESSAYNILACNSNMALPSNSTCEIMVQLANTTASAESNTKLSIIAGGVKYQKTLLRTSSAYIAGDFSQVYPYNGKAGLQPVAGNGNCGTNSNLPCQIVKYDFLNNNLTSVGTTDDAINGMVADNVGNIYLAGAFTTATVNGTTITGPSSDSKSSLILQMDTTNGTISDFINNTGTTNYPNQEVYALEYNSSNNTLYFAGGFTSMGTISASNGYPLVGYNISNNSFFNVLGDDINNPDAAISAIGFDPDNNLYLSGFYGTISQWPFNDSYSNRTINKCVLNGSSYECINGSDYSVSIQSNQAYQEPAFNLSFQPDGGLYAAGGFSMMYNTDSQLSLGSLTGLNLLAFNSNPSNLFAYGSWNSSASAMPDNTIGFVEPYDNNMFFIGGQFSTIGGIASDTNVGQCGINSNQSCMLATYNGSSWQGVFTTDGVINVLIMVDAIGAI